MSTNETTALATIAGHEFALLKADPKQIADIVRENCGADGLTAFDLDRIKIPASGGIAWMIPGLDGDEMAKEFVGVVLFHRAIRVYWQSTADGVGAGSPPDCSSNDCVTGVGQPGGACAQCPLARFGSAQKGAGQACKQVRQIFIIRPGSVLPVMLSLPPTSIGEAKKYFLRLASNAQRFTSVLTRFGLTKDRNAAGTEYSKAVLSKVGDLSPQQAEAFAQMAAALRPLLEQVRAAAVDYENGNGGNHAADEY